MPQQAEHRRSKPLRGTATERTKIANRNRDDFWEFPDLVVSNLVVSNYYADALFCPLFRPFALFGGLAFAVICGHLRSFACFCERPRLDQPCLGTPEIFSHKCQVARKFHRNLEHNCAPGSQNQIAIASDGDSHLQIAVFLCFTQSVHKSKRLSVLLVCGIMWKTNFKLGNPPAWHRGLSAGPFGPGTPRESERVRKCVPA